MDDPSSLTTPLAHRWTAGLGYKAESIPPTAAAQRQPWTAPTQPLPLRGKVFRSRNTRQPEPHRTTHQQLDDTPNYPLVRGSAYHLHSNKHSNHEQGNTCESSNCASCLPSLNKRS